MKRILIFVILILLTGCSIKEKTNEEIIVQNYNLEEFLKDGNLKLLGYTDGYYIYNLEGNKDNDIEVEICYNDLIFSAMGEYYVGKSTIGIYVIKGKTTYTFEEIVDKKLIDSNVLSSILYNSYYFMKWRNCDED